MTGDAAQELISSLEMDVDDVYTRHSTRRASPARATTPRRAAARSPAGGGGGASKKKVPKSAKRQKQLEARLAGLEEMHQAIRGLLRVRYHTRARTGNCCCCLIRQ